MSGAETIIMGEMVLTTTRSNPVKPHHTLRELTTSLNGVQLHHQSHRKTQAKSDSIPRPRGKHAIMAMGAEPLLEAMER